jgi:hypothetical protein
MPFLQQVNERQLSISWLCRLTFNIACAAAFEGLAVRPIGVNKFLSNSGLIPQL